MELFVAGNTSPGTRRLAPVWRNVAIGAAAAVVIIVGAVLVIGPGEPPAPPAAAPPPPTAAPQQTQPPRAQIPAQLLDLQDWYLTLPSGADEDPDDVYQPELATYTDEWFRMNDTGDGVVFRVNAGGVTTEGSGYPRSELREMSGAERADWSSRSGTHTMSVRQAITQLPVVKPHIVAGQIHDSEDDVVLVRLEGERLMVTYDDGDGEIVIDPAYVLGTPFDLRITATARGIEIFYNGALAAEVPKTGSGWYFKAGAYLQSNPERGDDPDTVGEVVIYSLDVEHSG